MDILSLLPQLGENVNGDSGLSEVQSPFLRECRRGGQGKLVETQVWEQWELAALIPPTIYNGEGVCQGIYPRAPSPQILPRPPGDRRDLVFTSEALVRVSGAQ